MNGNGCENRCGLSSDDRGLSPTVGVVLLLAVTIMLSAVAVSMVVQFDAPSESVEASLRAVADDESGVFEIGHHSGELLSVGGEASLVVVGAGTSVTLDPQIDDGNFSSGDAATIPLEMAAAAETLDIVYRRGSGKTDVTLMEYDATGIETEGAWMGVGGDAGGTGSPTQFAHASSDIMEMSGSLHSMAIGPDGTVFYQKNGKLIAKNITSGTVRWKTNDAPTSNPVVHDGTLYVVISGELRAYDAETGKQQFATSSPMLSFLATDGKRLYGVSGQYAFAFSMNDGSKIWENTPGGTLNAPTVTNGRVYVSTNPMSGGTRYALDAADGSVIWSKSGSSTYTSPPVSDGTVFMKEGTEVVARNGATGDELWRTDVGDKLVGSPAVGMDVVYVADENNEVTAIDADSGDTLWTTKVGPTGLFKPKFDSNTRITIAGGTVYVGANGSPTNKLYALNRNTGKIRWSEKTNKAPPVAYPVKGNLTVWDTT